MLNLGKLNQTMKSNIIYNIGYFPILLNIFMTHLLFSLKIIKLTLLTNLKTPAYLSSLDSPMLLEFFLCHTLKFYKPREL